MTETAMPGVSFLYHTDIFDAQPVPRAFSLLFWVAMIQLHALGPILDQIYTRDSLEFTRKSTLDGRNGYTVSLIFAPNSHI